MPGPVRIGTPYQYVLRLIHACATDQYEDLDQYDLGPAQARNFSLNLYWSRAVLVRQSNRRPAPYGLRGSIRQRLFGTSLSGTDTYVLYLVGTVTRW